MTAHIEAMLDRLASFPVSRLRIISHAPMCTKKLIFLTRARKLRGHEPLKDIGPGSIDRVGERLRRNRQF